MRTTRISTDACDVRVRSVRARSARIPIMSHFMFQLHELEEHHSHRSLIMPENHPKINARTQVLVCYYVATAVPMRYIFPVRVCTLKVFERDFYLTHIYAHTFSNTGIPHHLENGSAKFARRNKSKKEDGSDFVEYPHKENKFILFRRF